MCTRSNRRRRSLMPMGAHVFRKTHTRFRVGVVGPSTHMAVAQGIDKKLGWSNLSPI